MELSRRRLLLLAPVAGTLAACGLPVPRPTVDVRDYGAVGDGVNDDSTAITAAAAALTPGKTLYFPAGSYRFAKARPEALAAIAISGVSDVAVEFARNAELLMDNLAAGVGTSHAILVQGPASGITLRNVRIRWNQRSDERSLGDGIRIVGYPDLGSGPPVGWTGPGGPVTGVRILDCEIASAPQSGVIMTGVSDIRVDGLTVSDTLADGLHFNACRRATVHNLVARNTGDDGLALVTYFADGFVYNTRAQTFSLPELNDWSNADFTITNVKVSDGGANGVRVSGANRVRIRWLTVTGNRSGAGMIADSAAPGSDAGWLYLSSQGLRLDRARITDCGSGIHLLARPGPAVDPRFTSFDLTAANTEIRDCGVWAVLAESLTAQRATGLRLDGCAVASTATTGGNGGVGLFNTGDVRLSSVTVSHPDPVTLFSATNSTGLDGADLRFAITTSAEEDAAAAPCVQIQDCAGRIDGLGLRWRGAPDSWQPVRILTTGTDCATPNSGQAVSVSGLTVEPPVTQPVITC